MTRVHGIHVRPVAGVDLLGWDEFVVVAFTAAAGVGCWLGFQISHLLGAVR